MKKSVIIIGAGDMQTPIIMSALKNPDRFLLTQRHVLTKNE